MLASALVFQASELSCPLPPSLVIPSPRLSTVATAAYKLLEMDSARVLVEGPSGAGKTALLSHLLKVISQQFARCTGHLRLISGVLLTRNPRETRGIQHVFAHL